MFVISIGHFWHHETKKVHVNMFVHVTLSHIILFHIFMHPRDCMKCAEICGAHKFSMLTVVESGL